MPAEAILAAAGCGPAGWLNRVVPEGFAFSLRTDWRSIMQAMARYAATNSRAAAVYTALNSSSFNFSLFTEACDIHDMCYSLCCQSKSECDEEFKANMREACRNFIFQGQPIPRDMVDVNEELSRVSNIACQAVAEIYYQAVSRFGASPYWEAQKMGCKNFEVRRLTYDEHGRW